MYEDKSRALHARHLILFTTDLQTVNYDSCFISLLYLDLYVLGDDALISKGSFMQTKYLCVLIHIWIKGEVGAVKPV